MFSMNLRCQNLRKETVTILGLRLQKKETRNDALWSKWQRTTEESTLSLAEIPNCLRTSFYEDDGEEILLLR